MIYRLALFDFDGTLADSADWFASQLPDLARRHRFRSTDAEEIESLRHRPTRDVVRALGVSPLRMPGIAADLRRRMAADASQIRLFDGVADMLQSLHDGGVRLTIVSSNSEANVRAVLGPDAALMSAFSCGASLSGKRPRFQALLKKFAVTPDQACAVGDELRDIEAAHQAGIAAAAVTWGYGAPDGLAAAAPQHLVRSPADLSGILLARTEGRPKAGL